MASSGNQDTPGETSVSDDPTVEAAAHVAEVVAASSGARSDADVAAPDDANSGDAGGDHDEPTVVSTAIPPLLTDTEPITDAETKAAVDQAESAEAGEEPTALGAPASKERIAEAAAAARDRVAGGASEARERAIEGASQARERGAEAAAIAKEKTGEAAAQAKEKTVKARKRFAAAASEAKGRASSAASEARERASQADVTEFAHSTTSLIDTARPFFLAGCAALFAVLGFLEGDAGTAQVFAVGAVIFVIGAAFSGEINAFLGSRSNPRDRRSLDDPS